MDPEDYEGMQMPVQEILQPEPVRRRSRVGVLVVMFFVLALAVGILTVFLNRQWVYDFYLGISYTPSVEMREIRDKLQLTERGEFIFNAVSPKLSESEEFNNYCRAEMDVTVAVLGCYTGGNVYVYNVTASELDGIRELTTAHELLHAVYARMSEAEKTELTSALEQVYTENMAVLENDLETYAEEERAEELYVRAGTEVKELPEVLEKHYAEIFKDQDLVVGFYDSYITVFREIKAEMEGLASEMEEIAAEIDTKTADYERRLKQYEADVVSFNACAEVIGCFVDENEFTARRNELVGVQNELNVLYDKINGLIDEYNVRVKKYNEDVTRTEKLNQMINSSQKAEKVSEAEIDD